MLRISVALFVSTLLGLTCCCCWWPTRLWSGWHLILTASLAVGTGIGLSGCTFFLWSVLFNPSRSGFIVGEVLVVVCVSAFLLRMRPARYPLIPLGASPTVFGRSFGYRRVLLVFSCISIACALLAFGALSSANPHGAWDAWEIWNLRARFIFRGGTHWTDAFSRRLSEPHPGYPLLIPTAVARCWYYVGADSAQVPVIIAALFTFASVCLVASSIAILRTSTQGLVAGLLLLATPPLVNYGITQYADVPLSFFILATLVLLCLRDHTPGPAPRLVFLAGLTAGLAAWTKNEGLLFLVCVSAARSVATVRASGWRAYLHEVMTFLSGAGPMLLLVVYFKLYLAPANYLFSDARATEAAARLLVPDRYTAVLRGFKNHILAFGFNGLVSVVWLLCIYLACVGVRVEPKHRLGATTAAVALCLMLCGYALAYLITPFDIQWHIDTSLERLLLQLWPSGVFLCFLWARPPEEVITPNADAKGRS